MYFFLIFGKPTTQFALKLGHTKVQYEPKGQDAELH